MKKEPSENDKEESDGQNSEDQTEISPIKIEGRSFSYIKPIFLEPGQNNFELQQAPTESPIPKMLDNIKMETMEVVIESPPLETFEKLDDSTKYHIEASSDNHLPIPETSNSEPEKSYRRPNLTTSSECIQKNVDYEKYPGIQVF